MTILLQRTIITTRTRLSSLSSLPLWKQPNRKQQQDDVRVDGRKTTRITCCFSSTTKEDNEILNQIHNTYVVHRRGDPGYGSREYLLCPPNTTSIEASSAENLIVAKLLAHRNMLFGARSLHSRYKLDQICIPLVAKALEDASKDGEQPQAIASLSGLSNWVQSCLDGNAESLILDNLQSKDYEAVQAIATGIPRKGHSVVGIGTYRDGEIGWKALGQEFVEKNLCDEANLYQNQGARLISIDHLAEKNPDYLQSAGGAMVRMFFIPHDR